jgi:flagellar biosynthesis chaperone FliJ
MNVNELLKGFDMGSMQKQLNTISPEQKKEMNKMASEMMKGLDMNNMMNMMNNMPKSKLSKKHR